MLSFELQNFIVKSASGGDLELEKYLCSIAPTLIPLSAAFAFSPAIQALQFQSYLVDAALDKSNNLVDHFTSNRTMLADSTSISKIIGDGETDNYRSAVARMKDRENSWNRVEREGEEDTKTYSISKGKGRLTEDAKHYDLSSNRSLNRSCSFEQMQGKTEGIGDSADFNSMARKSSSLSRTKNLTGEPLLSTTTQQFTEYFDTGNSLPVEIGIKLEFPDIPVIGTLGIVIKLSSFNRPLSIGTIQLEIPPIDYVNIGKLDLPMPTCVANSPDDITREVLTCDNMVESIGFGFRSAVKWNWEVSWSMNLFIISLTARVAGSSDRIYSSHVKNEQVCSNATSGVAGLTFGHNDYKQTGSSSSKGTSKTTSKSNTQHNSGNYNRGERVQYSRTKGEVKGLIEFCSQSDSASRRLRVATGNIDGVSKTWARTISDGKGQSKRITSSDTSSQYWNQMVKNLGNLKKLLLKRLEQQQNIALTMTGTLGEQTLMNLCSFSHFEDTSNGLCFSNNGLLRTSKSGKISCNR